jgi:predicted metal-dependent HD superfamily phosphohydrolase
MDAERRETQGQRERMRCAACGHEQACDDHQVEARWSERVPADFVPLEPYLLPSVRFHDLWRALGANGHADDVFQRLRASYDEPHRAYHTARHVGACLRLLDDATVAALATHLVEVEAAIWYHDAIYDTRASDNEERSARMAEESLGSAGVATDVVARIAAYIRATKDHVVDSADGQLVIDVDLSILGESPEVFAGFEEEIRREYSWVDTAAYAAGRAFILRRFTERPFIYGTALFRERYESQARDNIARSIETLARSL